MNGFSPEWLAKREPADHRSRDPGSARRVALHFASRSTTTVVDLGCGTGSNIRATSPLLGPNQDWTLVDHDPRLLAAARKELSGWADTAAPVGDHLLLTRGGKSLLVRFRQADLTRDLEASLGEEPDLVTASALFDLCSKPFIRDFAAAVARRRAVFYTVLTFNGIQRWTPPHDADAAMLAAFLAHQTTDKGFGASAGPLAPAELAGAFRAHGYSIGEGDSPWVLGPGDRPLTDELAAGFADAVRQTASVEPAVIAAWRAQVRTGGIVGHTDTLALPM